MLNTLLLVLFLFFILRGAWRGLTGEIAPLLGIAACLGVLFFGYAPLRSMLAGAFPGLDAQAHTFYAAVAIAILGGGLFLLVARLVKQVGESLVPQPFNAILGALIGALKVFLVVSLVGGVCHVVRDWTDDLLAKREGNPLAAAAFDFWRERFTSRLPEAIPFLPQPDEAPEARP